MRFNKFLNEGIQDKGIFKAVFLAGSPGSGKSFVASKIKSGQVEPKIVNTDKLYPLSKFKPFWSEGWPKINDEVKLITKNQLTLYINSLLPLSIDSTSNNVSIVLRRKGLLESFGYDTAAVFINTNLETALERAGKRERIVDPDFIKKTYDKINKAKAFYRKSFFKWTEIDNNTGKLTDEVVLKAFKTMSSFYNSPIQNPIGIEYKEKLLQNGWKYLSPNIMDISEIKKIIDIWYKK